MSFEKKTLGPFEALVCRPSSYRFTSVIFHGYGANAHDLSGLAPYLDPQGEMQWIFPEGPLSLGMSAYFDSRAWFELDMAGFEQAIAEGSFESYIQNRQEGLETIRGKALDFIDSIGVKTSELILGGFSQGSMLALDLGLRLETSPSGLLLFSSSLVDPIGWSKRASQKKGLSFLQSHGRQDPVLPFDLGEKLFNLLQEEGLNGEFHPFEGGHEIPLPVIERAKEFLSRLRST